MLDKEGIKFESGETGGGRELASDPREGRKPKTEKLRGTQTTFRDVKWGTSVTRANQIKGRV